MPPRSRQSTRRATARRAPEPTPVVVRKAVLYARVSSAEQEKEGFSIPAQQKLLRDYAAANGIHVEREFIDVETAKRAGRTHFVEMLDFLNRHSDVNVILVEKTDRLYRNLRDWVSLDDMDTEIHLVKEGTVLSDDSRSSEKFIHGIKVLMAKNYIDNLSEETKKGMLEKARQGIWPSRAPLGYRNVARSDGKRIIEQDPDVAPLIKQIFEWYASGTLSLKQLTRKAKDHGMVFRKSRKPLPISSIHFMLKNPLYMGEFDWDGVRYEGTHEPIVTRDLWEKVQDLLGSRATNCRLTQTREFAFSGLVYCGTCRALGGDYLYVGQIKKERYTYYHCEECRRRGRPVTYLKEERLVQAWTEALRTLKLDQEVVTWVRTALRASHEDEMATHADAIARLRAQQDAIRAKLNNAYEDKLEGVITAEFFQRKATDWKADINRLQRNIDAHDNAQEAYMELGILLMEIAIRAVELFEWADTLDKRQLLEFLCWNSVWDGERLEVAWRKPWDLIAESPSGPPNENAPGEGSEGDFAKWLPLLDLNQRPSD